MDFNELLVKRHSIRKYTEQHLDAGDVKTILEAALLAPSSKSKRPWQFIVVEEKETLEKLSKAKKIASHPIAGAAMAVVVISNPEESDVFIEDTSIAAVFIQLQAEALGIGSCWIQIRNRFSEDGQPAEEMVQNLLNIPQYLPVECIITFGYKNEDRRPVDTSKLLWEKVHIGKWKDTETK